VLANLSHEAAPQRFFLTRRHDLISWLAHIWQVQSFIGLRWLVNADSAGDAEG